MQIYESTVLTAAPQMNEKDSSSVLRAFQLMDWDLPAACINALDKVHQPNQNGGLSKIKHQPQSLMASDLHKLVTLLRR